MLKHYQSNMKTAENQNRRNMNFTVKEINSWEVPWSFYQNIDIMIMKVDRHIVTDITI